MMYPKQEIKSRLDLYRRENGVGPVRDAEVNRLLRELLEDSPKYRLSNCPFFVIEVSYIKSSTCYAAKVGEQQFVDFSVKKLLSPPSPRARVVASLRRAVNDQCAEFKRAAFDAGQPISALSGVPLTWDDTHVDHVRHFTLMARDWMEGLETECIEAGGGNPGDYDPHDFARYHRDWATLRLLTAQENLDRPNPEPRPDFSAPVPPVWVGAATDPEAAF